MSAVKRTRDGVDALEHALRSVHTSENFERIVSIQRQPGLIGSRSVVQIDVLDDLPLEQEVIVHLPRHSRRRAR
jgi:hypothetical protein